MLHSIITKARSLTDVIEFGELLKKHKTSPIYTTVIIEAVIRQGKYPQRSDQINQAIMTYHHHRDQKLRSIIRQACASHSINIQPLKRQLESFKRRTAATKKHQGLAQPTVQNNQNTLPLHYQHYQTLITRTKKQHEREKHISLLIEFHQHCFRHDQQKNKDILLSHKYDLKTLHQTQKPTPQIAVKDGAIYNKNQEDINNYQRIQTIKQLNHLYQQPYFYLYADSTKDIAIGKHAYRQAIISYTDPIARQLRFSSPHESTTIRADLDITDGRLNNILFHAHDQHDTNTYYYTDQHYPPHPIDLETNHFYHQKSGLSDISHLVSQNQDDVFRASIQGTSLIQGVSGSGKSNLIFHRIDYLIQQYPQQYKASRIAIITPNQLLKEYLSHTLQKSNFTFKETITTHYRDHRSGHHMPSHKPNTQEKKALQNVIKATHQAIQKKRQRQLSQLISVIDQTLATAEIDINNAHYKHTDPALLISLCDTRQQIKKTGKTTPTQRFSHLQKIIKQHRYHDKHLHGSVTVSQARYFNDAIFEKVENTIEQHIKHHQKQLTLQPNKRKTIIPNQPASSQKIMLLLLQEKQNKQIGLASLFPTFDYVLIDEFQDFHPRALLLLYQCYGNNMIFSGDFMQSKRYDTLDELQQYGINIAQHKTMTDNFRNTREIIAHTHQIFDQPETLFLAKRVVKRGLPVKNIQCPTQQQHFQTINNHINKLLSNDTESIISIIYFDLITAQKRYHQRPVHNKDNITSFPSQHHDQEFFHKTIRIISYEQSKGLESDHIVLIDSTQLLQSGLYYALKRYYIGCTRATQTLAIIDTHIYNTKETKKKKSQQKNLNQRKTKIG